ncbi:MAG: cobyrinate a,c-diamide synthase [Nitrospira bacterium HGW-Nitrospira-1]|nr:MAG: cobyrinate a,c-diamide synthase [Nitrospira bacterium HGW-Nitrospira-1]
MRGLVIAGTHSGCGKTTVTLGLLAALKKKGLEVQPFKAGPDFIDTGLHRLVTGRHSRNLDLWMCGEKYVKECFYKYSTDADIAVVEGVMGMYDGEFSTANLARLLNLPVILVVDGYGMAESAGAIVKGIRDWGSGIGNKTNPQPLIPNPYIAGVIFNRVASENHYKRLKDSVRDIPVLGFLPRDIDFEIPHRHLGLTTAEETPISGEMIETLANAVLRRIDMNRIVELTNTTIIPSFPLVGNYSSSEGLRTSRNDNNDNTHSPIHPFTHSPVIAIAYDKAFCFYYEDNLDLLRSAGAEIITFSPISDSKVPDGVDGIYIGGGYPELYAEQLSLNTSMLNSIRNWAEAGRPLYAECGGLMYLSQGIYYNPPSPLTKGELKGGCSPFSKREYYVMAGVFPFETQMKKGRAHLGYREIILKEDCILGKRGDRCRGHEFHYSEIKDRNQDEGYTFKNTLASYIHIHFGSNLNIARNFMGKLTPPSP